MNAKDTQLMFDYNQWANTRLLNATGNLTPEQFVKDLGNSYRSVRDTMTHILGGEWIWLMRWKGLSPDAIMQSNEIPDFQTLVERWKEVRMDQWNFISKISDESLLEVISYENLKGETWEYPLWQMMHQVVNHSTYHRGQVITMLRQLDAQPVPLDFLIFIDEQKNIPAVAEST
jgi:uncharacterized damage-inducible protein DinB